MGFELSAAARIVWNAALGMAVGAVASLAAIGFVDLVLLLNEWLLISPRSRFMQENAALLLAATVCVPAAGGLVVGLVHHYLVPERRPHGPPDVIRAVQGLDGRVPLRSGFLSTLTSLVSLGAGASVGQYGPLAHLGGTIGSLVARLNRHTERSATVWVGCGVAAAISTAFNAPLAGLVFAHEVILRHYSLRAFAPITVAAAVGHVVANVVFERPPLFRVEAMSVVSAPEFLGFIAIGVGGAFVAVAYMRAILHAGRLAGRVPVADWLKPMLAGAVLGLAAIGMPDILGIGKEALRFAVIDHAFAPGRACVPPRRQDPRDRALPRLRIRGRGAEPRPPRRHPVRGVRRQRRRAAGGGAAFRHRDLRDLRHGGGRERGHRGAAHHDPHRVRAHPELRPRHRGDGERGLLEPGRLPDLRPFALRRAASHAGL